MDEFLSLIAAAYSIDVEIKEARVTQEVYDQLCEKGQWTLPPPVPVTAGDYHTNVYPGTVATRPVVNSNGTPQLTEEPADEKTTLN